MTSKINRAVRQPTLKPLLQILFIPTRTNNLRFIQGKMSTALDGEGEILPEKQGPSRAEAQDRQAFTPADRGTRTGKGKRCCATQQHKSTYDNTISHVNRAVVSCAAVPQRRCRAVHLGEASPDRSDSNGGEGGGYSTWSLRRAAKRTEIAFI